MKTTITKEALRKARMGSVREDQKSQGFFDGRFVTRCEEDKILDFASKHKKEKLVEDSKTTNKLIESLFND